MQQCNTTSKSDIEHWCNSYREYSYYHKNPLLPLTHLPSHFHIIPNSWKLLMYFYILSFQECCMNGFPVCKLLELTFFNQYNFSGDSSKAVCIFAVHSFILLHSVVWEYHTLFNQSLIEDSAFEYHKWCCYEQICTSSCVGMNFHCYSICPRVQFLGYMTIE